MRGSVASSSAFLSSPRFSDGNKMMEPACKKIGRPKALLRPKAASRRKVSVKVGEDVLQEDEEEDAEDDHGEEEFEECFDKSQSEQGEEEDEVAKAEDDHGTAGADHGTAGGEFEECFDDDDDESEPPSQCFEEIFGGEEIFGDEETTPAEVQRKFVYPCSDEETLQFPLGKCPRPARDGRPHCPWPASGRPLARGYCCGCCFWKAERPTKHPDWPDHGKDCTMPASARQDMD